MLIFTRGTMICMGVAGLVLATVCNVAAQNGTVEEEAAVAAEEALIDAVTGLEDEDLVDIEEVAEEKGAGEEERQAREDAEAILEMLEVPEKGAEPAAAAATEEEIAHEEAREPAPVEIVEEPSDDVLEVVDEAAPEPVVEEIVPAEEPEAAIVEDIAVDTEPAVAKTAAKDLGLEEPGVAGPEIEAALEAADQPAEAPAPEIADLPAKGEESGAQVADAATIEIPQDILDLEERMERTDRRISRVEERAMEQNAKPAEEAPEEVEAAPEDAAEETPAPPADAVEEIPAEEPAEDAPAEESVAPAEEEVEEIAEEKGAPEPPVAEEIDELLEQVTAEPAVEEAAEPAVEEEVIEDAIAEEPAEELVEEEVIEDAIAEEPAEELFEEEMIEEAMAEEPAEELIEEEFFDEGALEEAVEELPAEIVEEELPAEELFEEPLAEDLAEPVDPDPAQKPVPAEVPEPATEPAAEPDVADADAEALPEELRHLIDEQRAHYKSRIKGLESNLELAAAAMKSAEYTDARDLYGKALAMYNDLPGPDRRKYAYVRRRARIGQADANYQLARYFFKAEQIEDARSAAQNALTTWPQHKGVPRLIAEIKKYEERVEKELARKLEPPSRRVEEPSYQEKMKSIAKAMSEGREHYVLGEYDDAMKDFETVLALDPYHKDAHALRRKVAQKTYVLRRTELEGTEDEMMQEVARAWRPEDYVPKVPDSYGGTEQRRISRIKGPKIIGKMKEVEIPELDFRQANIHDVIKVLIDDSRKYAPADWPERDRIKGINMVLKLDDTSAGASPPAPSDDIFGETVTTPTSGSDRLVTLNVRYITLFDALNTIVKVTRLKYRIDGDIVVIVDENEPEGDLVQRTYPVMPNFREVLITVTETSGGQNRGGGGGGGGGFIDIGDEVDFGTGEKSEQEIFEELGIPFPKGSSLRYVRQLGKIFVSNTPGNLLKLEDILQELNVTPKQIEIEARFVDVGETDLMELGLEWLLTDDYEAAVKDGPAGISPAGRERITIEENAGIGGFTRGLRFLSEDDGGIVSGIGSGLGSLSSILTVQSLLTNPEMRFVLHALEQNGNANLLSAPKVLAQNGEEAEIKVVREFIYPTEFETEPIQSTSGDGNQTVTVGQSVTPSSFETREVGVLLNVIPEVSPDGNLITLTLTPQVVSGPDFIDYGSEIVLPDGTINRTSFQQPIFFVRTVQTRVMIYDGATVVMGGMITEELTKVDDKVPLLGDIPVLGRLFRNKSSNSTKRNLLIFVTARLVNPAGEPTARAAGAGSAVLSAGKLDGEGR